MTKTQARKLGAELRELQRRGKRILSGSELPWGVPWCAGAGLPYVDPDWMVRGLSLAHAESRRHSPGCSRPRASRRV